MNGDSHVFVRDQPLPEVPNLTRVMVPGESDTQAVAFMFDPGGVEPLRLEVIGEPGNPPHEERYEAYKATRDAMHSR